MEDVPHFRYLTSKIQLCTSLKPHTTSAFASEQCKTRKKQGKSDCSWQSNLSRGTAASQDGRLGGKGGLCTWIFQLLIPAGRAIPLFQGNSVHTHDSAQREPRMPPLPAVPVVTHHSQEAHTSFPGNTTSPHTALWMLALAPKASQSDPFSPRAASPPPFPFSCPQTPPATAPAARHISSCCSSHLPPP